MPREVIFLIGAVVAGVILITILLFAMIKTAKGNEALVVSGVGATDKNGNPKIKRAGGCVVIPFIQKAKYFDLCVRTAKVTGDVTKTQTGVPIQIDWAVAYNPDVSSNESLQRDTDVKRAQFMAETAREQAKSQMAGQLEQESINQQLAEKKGAVMVTQAEQANRAALKQQKVEITRAETMKRTTVINAEAEAEVGKNAKFYDFGGGAKQEGGGDLLTGILGRIPQVFAQADMQNQAMNGEELTDTVRKLVAAVADPIKGKKVAADAKEAVTNTSSAKVIEASDQA